MRELGSMLGNNNMEQNRIRESTDTGGLTSHIIQGFGPVATNLSNVKVESRAVVNGGFIVGHPKYGEVGQFAVNDESSIFGSWSTKVSDSPDLQLLNNGKDEIEFWLEGRDNKSTFKSITLGDDNTLFDPDQTGLQNQLFEEVIIGSSDSRESVTESADEVNVTGHINTVEFNDVLGEIGLKNQQSSFMRYALDSKLDRKTKEEEGRRQLDFIFNERFPWTVSGRNVIKNFFVGGEPGQPTHIAWGQDFLTDTFEDGDISEYSGDTSDFTVQDNTLISGNWTLKGNDTSGNAKSINRTTDSKSPTRLSSTVKISSGGFSIKYKDGNTKVIDVKTELVW